jgi:excisionase family DNA binding protein
MPIADVAHNCRISERTIRRWIRDGRLPTTKVGRTTLISPHAAALLANQSRNRRQDTMRTRLLDLTSAR